MISQGQLLLHHKGQYLGRNGFITIELLIALALAVVGLTSVVVLGMGVNKVQVDTVKNREALTIASKNIENAKQTAKYNFKSIVSTATVMGSYSLTSTVTDYDCLKHFVSKAEYVDDGRNQQVSLDTYITDPTEAFRFGGDCKLGFPQNWGNPGTYDSVDISPGGNNGTGLDVQRINGTRYVFMSSKHSSLENSDLWIFDLTSLANPVLVSDVNTGLGINDIDSAKVGNDYYVFAAQDDGSNQLQVLKVTNPSVPIIVAEEKLSGVNNPAPEGHSIRFYNNKVYIGTKKTNGDELHIFDVSDPGNPNFLQKYTVNQNVNDIRVTEVVVNGQNKTYAYLGLSTTGNENEIIVLDVTNVNNISQVSGINLEGNHAVNTINFNGNMMYVGRDESNNGDEVFVYNITNPGNPVLVGGQNVSMNGSAGIVSLVVVKDLMFMGTSDPNEEFIAWNLAGNGSMTKISSFNFAQGVAALDYLDDIVVVAVKSNDAFHTIYDQDNPPQ